MLTFRPSEHMGCDRNRCMYDSKYILLLGQQQQSPIQTSSVGVHFKQNASPSVPVPPP